MKHSYVFGCPVCRKVIGFDEPGEPMCTGPSETRDEHEMTVMRLLKLSKTEVHPRLAEKRAEGKLIMPDMENIVEADARRIIQCS